MSEPDTLAARVQMLLGLRTREQPLKPLRAKYHAAFDRSGEEKAKDIINVLSHKEKLDLSTCAYLSIGGSTGSEIDYIFRNTPIRHGVLLEQDNDACRIAQERADALKKDLKKTFTVVVGDAFQQIEECRREYLEVLRTEGKISGLVASVQSLLHELPYRSPGFDLDPFLGHICWDWEPLVLISREPCAPSDWPERVKLRVPGLTSKELQSVANDIAAYLKFPSKAAQSGPNAVALSAGLAVETLMKLFYIEDYLHEIQEQTTSINPQELVAAIEAHTGSDSVDQQRFTSASFRKLYRQHAIQVTAMDGKRVPIPNVFIRLVAERESSAGSAAVTKLHGTLGVGAVFKEKGKPDYTYVPRDRGEYEKRLLHAISSAGTLTLLTGPSKTGKTTLYKQVFHKNNLLPVVVRCDQSQDDRAFWNRVMTAISNRLEGKQLRLSADPGVLSVALKCNSLNLVVEDFHYLNRRVQQTVFQQWKEFTDEEVSVLIVETRHHAVDLAEANRELCGRTELIDVSIWGEEDLQKISEQGFACLNLEIDAYVPQVIAREAVGLPIIAQQCARTLLLNRNIEFRSESPRHVRIQLDEIFRAFHDVAVQKYEHYAPIVKRLQQMKERRTTGISAAQLALAILTLDPPLFEYDYETLSNRLSSSILPRAALPQGRERMLRKLRSLNRFYKSLNIELVEWYEKDSVMHVLEPAFIFYLRWRKPRSRIPSTSELFAEIFPHQMSITKHGYVFKLE